MHLVRWSSCWKKQEIIWFA